MTSASWNGIAPTGYRVLIEPDEVPEEITPSGIVIPKTEQEKYQQAQPTGVIRAIGPDAWTDHDEAWAAVGDRVAFDKYTGMTINGEDGTECRLINDTQVLALVSEKIELGQLRRRTAYEQ